MLKSRCEFGRWASSPHLSLLFSIPRGPNTGSVNVFKGIILRNDWQSCGYSNRQHVAHHGGEGGGDNMFSIGLCWIIYLLKNQRWLHIWSPMWTVSTKCCQTDFDTFRVEKLVRHFWADFHGILYRRLVTRMNCTNLSNRSTFLLASPPGPICTFLFQMLLFITKSLKNKVQLFLRTALLHFCSFCTHDIYCFCPSGERDLNWLVTFIPNNITWREKKYMCRIHSKSGEWKTLQDRDIDWLTAVLHQPWQKHRKPWQKDRKPERHSCAGDYNFNCIGLGSHLRPNQPPTNKATRRRGKHGAGHGVWIQLVSKPRY